MSKKLKQQKEHLEQLLCVLHDEAQKADKHLRELEMSLSELVKFYDEAASARVNMVSKVDALWIQDFVTFFKYHYLSFSISQKDLVGRVLKDFKVFREYCG